MSATFWILQLFSGKVVEKLSVFSLFMLDTVSLPLASLSHTILPTSCVVIFEEDEAEHDPLAAKIPPPSQTGSTRG